MRVEKRGCYWAVVDDERVYCLCHRKEDAEEVASLLIKKRLKESGVSDDKLLEGKNNDTE